MFSNFWHAKIAFNVLNVTLHLRVRFSLGERLAFSPSVKCNLRALIPLMVIFGDKKIVSKLKIILSESTMILGVSKEADRLA